MCTSPSLPCTARMVSYITGSKGTSLVRMEEANADKVNIGCNEVAEGGVEELHSGSGKDALVPRSRHYVE